MSAFRTDEAGTSLLEILVAVAILGIAVVAVVSGMGTSIITTDHHAKQAQAHTVLVSAAEAVKSETTNPYQPCATAATYSPSSGVALPGGWTSTAVAVASVEYWNGSAFTSGCPSPEQKLQLVRIAVTSPDDRAVESVTIVKRNPA